jgi:transposase-like protein
MPIDQSGTAPGLTSKPEEIETLNMRCKSHPRCDSMLVIEMKHEGIAAGYRMYQCTKCKMSWGVAVGGSVNL